MVQTQSTILYILNIFLLQIIGIVIYILLNFYYKIIIFQYFFVDTMAIHYTKLLNSNQSKRQYPHLRNYCNVLIHRIINHRIIMHTILMTIILF